MLENCIVKKESIKKDTAGSNRLSAPAVSSKIIYKAIDETTFWTTLNYHTGIN